MPPPPYLSRINQHDDVLVGVPASQLCRSLRCRVVKKVAVAVEGVEMRAEGGLVPDALGWDARSTFCLDGDFTATMLKRSLMLLKGSWAKMASVALRIFQEDRHLCIGIAFSHVCDVDASVVSAACCRVTYGVVCCLLMNQNVFGATWWVSVVVISRRLLRRSRVMSTVSFGIGTRNTFSKLCVFFCLWIGEPFLEEGGEGVAIDDFARAVVAYGYLSVALYREFGQLLPFPYQRGITLSSSTAIICCFWLPAKV